MIDPPKLFLLISSQGSVYRIFVLKLVGFYEPAGNSLYQGHSCFSGLQSDNSPTFLLIQSDKLMFGKHDESPQEVE